MKSLIRLLLLAGVAGLVILVGAGDLMAQENATWPAFPLQGKDWRGPGHYLSWLKIMAAWLVFLPWVWTTDWVSRDVQELKLDHLRWNPIVFGSFFAAFILAWLVPYFWIGFPLLLIAFAAPLASYVVYRNGKVTNDQRVLTPAHLRWWAAKRLARIGIKIEAEARDPHTKGAPVQLLPRGGPDERAESARLLAARQSTGLAEARQLLADGLACRASAVMVDYTQQAAAVQYLVDGVWLARGPLERETADPALEAMKLLCGLNPQERAKRQEGKFSVEYNVLKRAVFQQIEQAKAEFRKEAALKTAKRLASPEVDPATLQLQVQLEVARLVRERFASPLGPWTPVQKADVSRLKRVGPIDADTALEPVKTLGTLVAQGTKTGERALIQFEEKKTRFQSLDELGMRAKTQEQLKELLGRSRGFFLFTAMPANGLRSTVHLALRSVDRLVREFEAVEEENNRYEAIENVPVITYNAAAGQSPADVLPKLFRREPNVVVVRDLVNAETVRILCEEVGRERLMVGTVRARDAAEALLRVLALGVAPAAFAGAVTGVLNQRLVRKLCESCKEAYVPAPQVLQQLNIPEGRVAAFYRPPQPNPEDLCVACGGVGYVGRTALFELLIVDDAMRKVLATAPKLEVLRQLARKAGCLSIQEEGILLVAKGITSLPELMRLLKQ